MAEAEAESGDLFGVKARAAKARAESLSPDARTEIARTAALARWHADAIQATHAGTVYLGDLELDCAVLEDGRRVLSERSVLRAFGLSRGGKAMRRAAVDEGTGVRYPLFLAAANLRPFIDSELGPVVTQPIMYRPPARAPGGIARGLDALLIPKVCEVWLKARDAGALTPQQKRIGVQADALVRGLARVGIIALIDSATGYDHVRDRMALQAILDAYLSRELAAWAQRFPDEFYKEMFRLRGWTWDDLKKGKGQGGRVVGRYTNDLVYARLTPGILDELQLRNPTNEKGQRKAKHHQWLTDDVGHAALAQHLYAITGLMRASDAWDGFLKLLNRAFPRQTDLSRLPLFNQPVASIAPTPPVEQNQTEPDARAS